MTGKGLRRTGRCCSACREPAGRDRPGRGGQDRRRRSLDGRLKLGGSREIGFDEKHDVRFLQRERLPHHSNGMRFTAFDASGAELEAKVYYSTGGGAVVDEAAVSRNAPPDGPSDLPYSFSSSEELLAICAREDLTIGDVMRANERSARDDAEIDAKLGQIIDAMSACIDRGMAVGGILPGGLNVKRRAPPLYRLLSKGRRRSRTR